MDRHFIFDDQIEIKDGSIQCDPRLFDDHSELAIAWVAPATEADTIAVLLTNTESGDGRSKWKWLRLRDGTLMLGVFPQGDTYMHFNDGDVCNFGE